MKKILKRILSCFLALILSFQCVNWEPFTAYAEDDEVVEGLNLDIYRVEKYLQEDSVSNRSITYWKTTQLPSQIIVDNLNQKAAFVNAVGAWKLIHYANSPSEIAEGAIDEKGYYEAMILSIFVSQATMDHCIFDLTKKVTSETNTILSSLKKWVKESEEIDLNSLSKNQTITGMSDDEKDEILKYLKSDFGARHPALDVSSSISSTLSTCFSAVKTVGEAVELMAYYSCVYDLSVEVKAVLQAMYEMCPSDNVACKGALQEIIMSMDNFNAGIVAAVENATQEQVLNGVLGTLLDAGWEKVLESNPYVKAFSFGADIGIKIGDMVCKNLFSTDKTIEQYEKMSCLGEFIELIRNVTDDMGEKFLADSTAENADNYLAALDAMFAASLLSCDYASDYAEILYEDSSLGWIFISEANYDEYISDVAYIKKACKSAKENLNDLYLAELEYEYPDVYAIVMGLGEEEYIEVNGIEFQTSEMTIGLKDTYIYSVGKPTVSPSNATDQSIKYYSSDSSIVAVNENAGWLFPYKIGTVTITATAADGKVSDTMQVTVVAGTTGNGENIYTAELLSGGQCGLNAYWNFYDNGTLVISGSGEMGDVYGDESWDIVLFYYGCKNVIIGNEITSISWSAFEGCSSLQKIEIPDSVTSIGYYAFSGCSSLKEIEIPNSVTSIGRGAFSDCSSLKEIEIPDSVTSIGRGAFSDCSSLKEIEIPDSITDIDWYAFKGCSSLQKIEIPDSVTSIEEGAFSGCSSLKEIEIPDSVASIGDYTFYGGSSLQKIVIPDSVTSMGKYIFDGCDNIVIWGYPESVAEQYAKDHNIPFQNILAPSHIWDTDYTIDKEPTYTETGSKSIHCSHCDETKDTVEIPMLNGLAPEENGVRYYYENGEVKTSLTQIVEDDGILYYVTKGVVSGVFTGLVENDGSWIYVKNSVVDYTYTGLCKHTAYWYYVENGVVNLNYTGLCEHGENWFYIENGIFDKSYTGLYEYNGNWYYVEAGVVDQDYTGDTDSHIWDTEYTIDKVATCTEAGSKSIHCSHCDETKDSQTIPATGHTLVTDSAVAATYTQAGKTEGSHCSECGEILKKQETIPALKGLAPAQNGTRTYYENGKVKTSLTTLMKDSGTWYYVEKGVVSGKYTGLVKYNGSWFYVKNSKVDFSYTGLCKYNGSWYYVEKGVLNWNYTGLCKFGSSWYYVQKGVLNWKYTGLCKYGSTWYYVQKGVLNWKYTGLCKYGSSWYYVQKGVLNWNYTGLCKYGTKWYYVQKGVLNWKYTGLCKYGSSWYYVQKGVLNWNYTGLCKYGSSWYYVKNGVLNWNYTGLCKYGTKWYYVQKGVVNFKYTGYTNYGGSRWYVKNGVMVKKA